MKNIATILVFVFASFLMNTLALGQGDPCAEFATVQPKIIVIPFAKEGEDIRTVIEDDFQLRSAIIEIQNAFNAKDFKTFDFIASLKAANEQKIWTSEESLDMKSELALFAGADIWVDVEFEYVPKAGSNSVNLNIKAYESSTGAILGAKAAKSNFNASDDITLHVKSALKKELEPFLSDMNGNFALMRENGKPIVLNMVISSDSMLDFDEEIAAADDEYLSDAIREWIADNAVKGYYMDGTATGTRFIIPEIRIPVRDPVSCRNYYPNDFARAFRKYLKSIGISCSKEVKSGTVYITIK